MFRVLQADLDSSQSMATLGIIHSVAEVLERSMMFIIDHFCHVLWKRKSAPWGSFRTPRRERLMSDTSIVGMLYESIGLMCVNGFFLPVSTYLREKRILCKFASIVCHPNIDFTVD